MRRHKSGLFLVSNTFLKCFEKLMHFRAEFEPEPAVAESEWKSQHRWVFVVFGSSPSLLSISMRLRSTSRHRWWLALCCWSCIEYNQPRYTAGWSAAVQPVVVDKQWMSIGMSDESGAVQQHIAEWVEICKGGNSSSRRKVFSWG